MNNPIYLDLHIHTSENANKLNESYDVALIKTKIEEFCGSQNYLISFTDHNTINKKVYIDAIGLGMKLILGVELHIKMYEDTPAYHCHIYFNTDISDAILTDINDKLDELYDDKMPELNSEKIPDIDAISRKFDTYEFILLPHGGQSHGTFDNAIPKEGVRLDSTIERVLYYNQIDGFTSRSNAGLEKTKEYFIRLGINGFTNLMTCSDNYTPTTYPACKAGTKGADFLPTWMFSEPTFDGLRLALSENSRLVYSIEKPKCYSESIGCVKLSNDMIDIDVMLRPGLNVVVGGSSSGKTLFVDSIYKKISCDIEKSVYLSFGVQELEIFHPSGTKPYYISQNYIASFFDKSNSKELCDIPILGNIFPETRDIDTKINNKLQELKYLLQKIKEELINVEKYEEELKRIFSIHKLIFKGHIKENIIDKLRPTPSEKMVYSCDEAILEKHRSTLMDVSNFLKNNMFIQYDSTPFMAIDNMLNSVEKANKLGQDIGTIINREGLKYASKLEDQNQEGIIRKSNVDNLLQCIYLYITAKINLNKNVTELGRFSFRCDTQEIESQGHKLSIVNDFKLTTENIIEAFNSNLKVENKINELKEIYINPEKLFKRYYPGNKKIDNYDVFFNKIFNFLSCLNKKQYKIVTKDGKDFNNLSSGWKTSVILDIILGHNRDYAPIIIDQPEDNLASQYINNELVESIKHAKINKQIILATHNATIPMLADAQNVIYCKQESDGKIMIKSAPLEGKIEEIKVLDIIASITDGGKSSIKKRVKKYNLKKFRE